MYLEKEQDTWHLGGCNEENKKKKKKQAGRMTWIRRQAEIYKMADL